MFSSNGTIFVKKNFQKLLFSRFGACKNSRENDRNSRKKRFNHGVGKNMPKLHAKIGFRKALGSIWEGVGALWGVSWTLLGTSWLVLGRSRSSLFKALVQDRLQEAFRIDFGKVLGGFGETLEGSWAILEWILKRIRSSSHLKNFLETSLTLFNIGTPMRLCFALRSVTILISNCRFERFS